MANPHDGAVVGAGAASSASGNGIGDDERVIAAGDERLRHAAKTPRPSCDDARHFAVHQLRRADDGAAERDADALVPEADAEYRNARAQAGGSTSTVDPGILRPSRSRRDDDLRRAASRSISSSEISSFRRTHRSRAELAQILRQVERERVVVVDEQRARVCVCFSQCSRGHTRALSLGPQRPFLPPSSPPLLLTVPSPPSPGPAAAPVPCPASPRTPPPGSSRRRCRRRPGRAARRRGS